MSAAVEQFMRQFIPRWHIGGICNHQRLGMAVVTTLGILLLLPLHQTCAALDIFAPSPQKALITNDTVLNCTFSLDKKPMDMNFLAVLWSFQGNVVLTYDKKAPANTQDPRMSLNVESLKDGDASLHLSDVAISDGGIYKCAVIYSPERKEKEIVFHVLARPLLSILSTKAQRNTENTLTCKASGFFPPDIRILWYRKDEVLRNQIIGKPQMYKDGTYQITSTVTIPPMDDDHNQVFSCRVQHDSLEEPLENDFHLIFEETSSSVVTVLCIILVFISIIAVGIGIFWWHRKNRKTDMGRSTVMDIEGPTKLIAGVETSLSCTAINVPKNISVTWLEKRGGQVREIHQESRRGDPEEEERLMDTQYGVLSWREGPNYTSSLTFRPSVTKHKDVTFICRYSCGKQKKEKIFHCRTIYAKPRLLQPISRRLIVPRELRYLVTLEKFYPRDIPIRWTHGVGEPQEALTSQETFTDIPDGTHSVCSEVRIPEELLKDPEYRVRVSWEHESLATMEYKDLSLRDSEYAWNPIVEVMETPNVVHHNTPFTLQCRISEYFPDAINVTWLRRSENQELCEEKDNVVSCAIIPRKDDNNTYSCTASLTIVPILSVHQGAEYICRVDHPSLERPIERGTKKLAVNAIPRMVEPIEIQMRDSAWVCFTLHLQKFYPKDVDVKWRYEDKDKNLTLQSNSTFVAHDDLTYGITNVANISTKSLNDPQFKVSVTWNHASMAEPETRTLTVRDLPWLPQVGEIIIPELREKKKTSLTCNIFEYFPDHLSVSWCKKEPGRDSHPTPLPNSDYKISNSTKSQKGKLFCQSSLTFTYSSSRDRGAEFFCRVEHPSLEQPIQRSSGPIGLPMNSSV